MPGQTLSEIRSILACGGLAPRHALGQNFLIDLNLMRKLVSAAAIRSTDVVLEVGPGTGSLTELLLERGAGVIAVEVDRGLQRVLAQRLGGDSGFTLIAGDALAGKHEINAAVVEALRRAVPSGDGRRKLVANLPYQIATPLLIELLLLPDLDFELLACTIQKEVADRLAAAPGSDAYGPAGVVVQSLATVRNVARLPPSAFWPVPNVESTMVLLTPRPIGEVDLGDRRDFARFVQMAFHQRRKMLRRSGRDWGLVDVESVLASAGIDPDARPEQITVAGWQALHRAVGSAPRR